MRLPIQIAALQQAPALQNALHADLLVWLNLVERFFADLTGDVIRAGSFASVNQLVCDINAYLARRNADPKPYLWRAQGADILANQPPAPQSDNAQDA